MENINFYYTNDNTTICVLTHPDSGQKFVGIAKCNPGDSYNQRIGEQIAEMRAETEIYRYLRESYREEENRLKILITDMEQSKKYNPKSYEAKSIKRQYWNAKSSRIDFDIMIKHMKDTINSYIAVRCK